MSEQRIGILIEAVNKSGRQFQEVKGSLEELEYYRRRASKYAYTEQRAIGHLVNSYRQQHRAVYDTIGVLRTVGSIGGQLLTMWNSQNIAQLRLAQSIDNVTDAQEYLNEMLLIFGEDSVDYEDALDRLTDAEERVEAAQRSVETGNALMVLNLLGTVGSLGTFAMKIGELAIKYTGVSTALGAIAAFAGGIAVPVAITIAGLAALKALLDHLNQIKAWQEEGFGGGAGEGGGGTWMRYETPPDTNINVYIDKIVKDYDVYRLLDLLKIELAELRRGD